MDKKTIVVCGATGQQGGATIDAILKRNKWDISAFSRNPESEKAKALHKKGIRVVKGDLLDKASLVKIFKDVSMVFGVTQPFSKDYKKVHPKEEIEQGLNIVDACIEAGVEHLVFSTVFTSGMEYTGVAHLDSKITIANHLKNNSISYTILKPASFMDNIGSAFFPVKKGYIRGFIDKDVKVPYVSTKDIGEFATLVFEQPSLYRQKELDVVADFISGEELALILEKIRKGEHFKYKTMPRLLMRIFAKEFYEMRVGFEKRGRPPYPGEIENAIKNCKKMYPDIMTVEKYLLYRKYDEKNLE